MVSTVPILSMTQTGNILFRLENSFNCFYCCSDQIEGTDHIYINENGNVELFDTSKKNHGNEDFISRDRIRTIVINNISLLQQSKRIYILRALNDENFFNQSGKITFSEIQTINQLFMNVLKP